MLAFGVQTIRSERPMADVQLLLAMQFELPDFDVPKAMPKAMP